MSLSYGCVLKSLAFEKGSDGTEHSSQTSKCFGEKPDEKNCEEDQDNGNDHGSKNREKYSDESYAVFGK